jgi:nitroreductase
MKREKNVNFELPSNKILLEQLNWRYAVKKFDAARGLSDEDWQALEEVLILTPTSYGLQPYKFIVVTCPKTKERLMEHAWNQTQVRDCSHLVVIAGKTNLTEADVERYLERVVEVRKVSRESQKDYANVLHGFSQKLEIDGKTLEWAARQAYLALGFLMTAAALRGIDSCPLEGFIPENFNEVLDLESQNLSAIVLCALGYRADDDWLGSLAKVRMPQTELVHHV